MTGRPLEGRRILDLTRYAPGPYATLVCACLGAEVIKVESKEGDPMRALDEAGFARLNAGKKSVILDLKTAFGRESLLDLAATADALVEGFRPGVMARLGLDYACVSARAPSLVYVSLSGYGQSGPYAARAGHDVNYMAAAGALQGVNGPLSFQFADFAAGGLFTVLAILSGLLSGRGTHVDLSIHDALLSLSMLPNGAAFEALSGRYPNYGVYETRDGESLAVAPLEPKFWEIFCGVLERPDLVGRARDPEAREEVARVLRTRDAADWEARFGDSDACVERVLRADAAREHAQARARGHAALEFSLPFDVDDAPALGRAPSLGEHTESVLEALR